MNFFYRIARMREEKNAYITGPFAKTDTYQEGQTSHVAFFYKTFIQKNRK